MGFRFWGVRIIPNFPRPLAAKLCVGGEHVFEVQESTYLLYHYATFGGAGISHATRRRKRCFVCLFFVFVFLIKWVSNVLRLFVHKMFLKFQ